MACGINHAELRQEMKHVVNRNRMKFLYQMTTNVVSQAIQLDSPIREEIMNTLVARGSFDANILLIGAIEKLDYFWDKLIRVFRDNNINPSLAAILEKGLSDALDSQCHASNPSDGNSKTNQVHSPESDTCETNSKETTMKTVFSKTEDEVVDDIESYDSSFELSSSEIEEAFSRPAIGEIESLKLHYNAHEKKKMESKSGLESRHVSCEKKSFDDLLAGLEQNPQSNKNPERESVHQMQYNNLSQCKMENTEATENKPNSVTSICESNNIVASLGDRENEQSLSHDMICQTRAATTEQKPACVYNIITSIEDVDAIQLSGDEGEDNIRDGAVENNVNDRQSCTESNKNGRAQSKINNHETVNTSEDSVLITSEQHNLREVDHGENCFETNELPSEEDENFRNVMPSHVGIPTTTSVMHVPRHALNGIINNFLSLLDIYIPKT